MTGAQIDGDLNAGTIGTWTINNKSLGYEASLKPSSTAPLRDLGLYHPGWVNSAL
jgi:hypothetical protein